MTGTFADKFAPRAEGDWLKDIIRGREETGLARQFGLPAGQRALSLQTENFPTPHPSNDSALVRVSRNIWDFCANTLNYIGEHPVQFALSIGTAMAVRWAVTIGLGAVTGGAIAGLGLAIASAMITSVVLGTGRAALKGQELNAKDLTGKALLSGLIAGVIGAFLGGHIPVDKPTTELQPLPQQLPHPLPQPVPHNALPVHVIGVDPAAVESPYTGVEPVASHYVWDIDSWKVMQDRFHSAGEDYIQIKYNSVVAADDLLKKNTDWYIFLDENQHPYQAMHKDALKQMVDFSKHRASEFGLKQFEEFNIHNYHFPNASTAYNSAWGRYHYDLSFDTSVLTDEKDIFHGALDHELGHVVYHVKGEPGDLSSVKEELYADSFTFRYDNYGGYVEGFVRVAIARGTLDTPILDPAHVPTHPTDADRILYGIKSAAADPSFSPAERADFALRLKECQQMLNKYHLGHKMNLLQLWKEANAPYHTVTATQSTAVEEAATKWQDRILQSAPADKSIS